jgi:two-component system, NtrC family, nitrogen regulation sensor histidine kinase NtrY
VSGAARAASAFAIALPSTVVAAWAIHSADPSPPSRTPWMLLAGAILVSIALAWWMEGALRKRLRTITSVLEAYREGDFSIRARAARWDTRLDDVLTELNQLGDVLRTHRHGEMEAWGLLRKVMAEVDVVVLAIDDDGRVRLANDAAARVLGRASRDLVGERAVALGIGDLLEGTAPRVVHRGLGMEAGEGKPREPSSGGPWELRRGAFRLSGEQQTLIVLSDVSRALRDNEREAWRRLIRVIGHEINNSLSPIQSISESLLPLADATNRAPDWETDLRDGLAVIARRAEALGRFMASYARLARLPPPQRKPVHVASLVRKIVSLETRVPVEVLGGPDLTVSADADQLEQVLINLVKNATDATLEATGKATPSKPGVRVRWRLEEEWVALEVEDDGPGVGETANLFVPFFTTKVNGSGIGLVLSRQIAEAHEGRLSLASRTDGQGALARMLLPLLG